MHGRNWNPGHVTLTKAGLAAAKVRGVKLGGDRGYRPVTGPDARLGGAAVKLAADHAAHGVAADIERILAAAGMNVSPQALARELTAQDVATPRGGAWTATAVRRVLARV